MDLDWRGKLALWIVRLFGKIGLLEDKRAEKESEPTKETCNKCKELFALDTSRRDCIECRKAYKK